jgi:hypothetical protein
VGSVEPSRFFMPWAPDQRLMGLLELAHRNSYTFTKAILRVSLEELQGRRLSRVLGSQRSRLFRCPSSPPPDSDAGFGLRMPHGGFRTIGEALKSLRKICNTLQHEKGRF